MEIKASSFFSEEQRDQIRNAIKEAENKTSGEIRVHIETRLTGKVLDRAAWIFKKTGMHVTENRNGVLFYFAIRNKEFAIIGDAGINAAVPENFWDDIKVILMDHFRNEKFAEGLVKGILMAGNQLSIHFPRSKEDINELPDEITFDEPDLSKEL